MALTESASLISQLGHNLLIADGLQDAVKKRP